MDMMTNLYEDFVVVTVEFRPLGTHVSVAILEETRTFSFNHGDALPTMFDVINTILRLAGYETMESIASNEMTKNIYRLPRKRG